MHQMRECSGMLLFPLREVPVTSQYTAGSVYVTVCGRFSEVDTHIAYPTERFLWRYMAVHMAAEGGKKYKCLKSQTL
jgi:hypothetical protein